MAAQISHVVFDIGQVLLRWDPELLYRNLIPDPVERAQFFAEVCTSAWNGEQDRGRPWEDGETLLIEQFPEQADNIRAWRGRWHEMVPHAIEGSVQLLGKLIAAGVDVTLLSNFNQHTFEEVTERFAFLNTPRGRTISAHVGLIKPEAAIYALHTESFALEPSRTLFIDDLAANIDAAHAAGWRGHLFSDPDTLRVALIAEGFDV